jgi:hypothetical protein
MKISRPWVTRRRATALKTAEGKPLTTVTMESHREDENPLLRRKPLSLRKPSPLRKLPPPRKLPRLRNPPEQELEAPLDDPIQLLRGYTVLTGTLFLAEEG